MRIGGYLAGFAAMATLGVAPAAAGQLKVGDPAPSFRIQLLDQSIVTRESLKGQIVVINLWATWCAPCRDEMPMLDDMQRKLTGYNVRIIGVLVDDEISVSKVRNVGKLLGYPLAMHMQGAYPKIDEAVPSTYIIDRKGVIRYARAGAFNAKSFSDAIVPLVEESGP